MNERIRELAEQAGHKPLGTFLMDSYAKGMRYSAHLIKEHFGVESDTGAGKS